MSANIAGGLLQGKKPGAHGDDGEAVEDQSRGVIGQPLAFEHDDQPPRHAEAADHGERRHRVGRRHDGAEHETDRERHVKQPMRRRRHRAGREHDAAEGKQRDRPQIKAEFAPAHGDAGRIDQRRQNAEQHQVGRQFDPRQPGQERQRDTGDDEKDRRRCIKPPRGDGDDHQDGEKQQEGLYGRGQVLNPSYGLGGRRAPGASCSMTRSLRTVSSSTSSVPKRAFLIERRPTARWPIASAPTAIAPKAAAPSASARRLVAGAALESIR